MNRLIKPERPEFLLDLGRYVQHQQQAGISVDRIAWRWGVSAQLLWLSLAFTQGPAWLKLRALVEDWPLDRIAEAIQEASRGIVLHGLAVEKSTRTA